MFEPQYDHVYGSAIFAFSTARLERFRTEWPDAVVGGTGTLSTQTIEDIVGGEHEQYDYSDYPNYKPSLGFTQRGCRLKCKFCVVPAKEGKPRSVNTISDIWRGDPHPRKLHLLDNDFFGQPEDQWRARLQEVREGGFKICLNQGINVRLISEEGAEALAAVEYRDDQFQQRRIYTAWDNLKDERIFRRGVGRLTDAGIKPSHIMVYMLVGYDPAETWDRLMYRFNEMVAMGVLPYPMVYDRSRKDLLAFQRWAVTGLYRAVPWDAYRHNARREAVPSATLFDNTSSEPQAAGRAA
jgi:hypothetical protein